MLDGEEHTGRRARVALVDEDRAALEQVAVTFQDQVDDRVEQRMARTDESRQGLPGRGDQRLLEHDPFVAFSFEAQPDLDRDAVLQVFDCRFVAEAANIVFVGGVGTGKTHLSIALGMACCQHDYRVRFVTAAELVTLLVEAQQQGRLARKLAQLARFDLVICDELGYVPLDKAGADLLFGFISQRYERGSLVVTTNLPFTRWSEVFLDPTAAAAVIDRVVHHATVLQTTGGSFRLAAAKQNQAPAAGKKGAR